MAAQKHKKKLLENKKTGSSKELFLPGNDFRNMSTENISKKHPNFEDLEIHNGS